MFGVLVAAGVRARWTDRPAAARRRRHRVRGQGRLPGRLPAAAVPGLHRPDARTCRARPTTSTRPTSRSRTGTCSAPACSTGRRPTARSSPSSRPTSSSASPARSSASSARRRSSCCSRCCAGAGCASPPPPTGSAGSSPAGWSCWFGFQAFQNIGMNLGLTPVTGLPLPFVSYGGSSMFAQCLAVGVLLAIHRQSRSKAAHALVATPVESGHMPVESLFARLEPLLPKVAKPIQYVGGELNSRVKDWDSVAVRWALMYPDAYEVGLPNQGMQILYEVHQRARRTRWPSAAYAVWPDLEALMRSNGIGQFTVDAHRPVGGVRPARGLVLDRARLHQPAVRARPGRHPAARRRPRRRATRSSSPAGTPRSTPSRSPTSSTRPCSATASRSSARSPTSSATGRPSRARSPRRAAAAAGRAPAGSTSRASTTSATAPDGQLAAVDAEPRRRAGAGHQAHGHGPRRVALPEDAAGAAGRVRPRADERRDLPRLHPRLPVLPGRHDHPAGARAVDHRHRRDGRAGPAGHRLRRGRAAVALERRPLRDRRDRQGAGRPLRGRARSRCRCPRPGSTRSTSTWPTSSPATAAAPA